MLRSLWMLVAAFGLVGCGTFVTVTPLGDQAPSSTQERSARSVEVYASGPPARPHADVAILEVEQTRGLNEQGNDVMVERLRARAAEAGCDAVVLGGFSERGRAAFNGVGELVDPGAKLLHATCIVYRDEEPVGSLAPRREVSELHAAPHQRIDFEQPR